jgi:hypothetical protein
MKNNKINYLVYISLKKWVKGETLEHQSADFTTNMNSSTLVKTAYFS